ncbi:MAG: winged helix-turn-helix transcriptional regulator [Vicinamibacterales bacterium]
MASRPPPAPPLRSPCPIAGALDILGDAWTLLVLRDMLFYGRHRFAEFLASPEGISTNILADRLQRLERRGLIARRRYQQRPPRDEYCLTARGHDLLPVLQALIKWGQQHVPGVAQRPPRPVTTASRPPTPTRPVRGGRRL